MLTALITLGYLSVSFVVTLLLARWLEAGALSPAKPSTPGELILGESSRRPSAADPYAVVRESGELVV